MSFRPNLGPFVFSATFSFSAFVINAQRNLYFKKLQHWSHKYLIFLIPIVHIFVKNFLLLNFKAQKKISKSKKNFTKTKRQNKTFFLLKIWQITKFTFQYIVCVKRYNRLKYLKSKEFKKNFKKYWMKLNFPNEE